MFLLTNSTTLVAKGIVGAVSTDTGLAWWMGLIARKAAITIAAVGGLVTLWPGLSGV